MIDRHVTSAAAGFVEASQRGNPLQQCGFSGAVLADDDGDRPFKTQFEIIAQQWQAERIGLPLGDPRRIEPAALQIRRRQIDWLVSS
jgi:hypothetical protein